MKWVRVYKGGDLVGAHLVAHQLKAAGLRVDVRGQGRTSLRGELPIGESWPDVWVPQQDAEQAEALVRKFEGPELVHPAWVCPRCGESNEATFDLCWSCLSDGIEVSVASVRS